MPKIDPEITTEVAVFFGVDSISFTLFSFGEKSNAYSFSVNGQEYVLRVSLSGQGFLLDRLASGLIQDPIIPIPGTVYTGKCGVKYFSITYKVPGRPMIEEDDNTQLSLMNEFLMVSHAFHSYPHHTKLSGFGPVSEKGEGKYQTWESFINDQTPCSSPLWPPGYFDMLNKLKQNRLIVLPDVRCLIHGDYGYKNIIVNSGEITGVIDWEDAKFGDFVYDIAYIHFWASQTDFQKIFYKFYSTYGMLNMTHFKKRFDCYTLYIGISLLNYFALKNDSDTFSWIKQKVDQFVGQNSLDGQ